VDLSRSDDELLAAARREPEAFAAFYRRHVDAVLRYLLYRTRSAEDAAELTAEVFAAALESSRCFKRQDVPARAWLFGIAGHKLADSRRRRRIAAGARRRLGVEPLALDDLDLERVEELADLQLVGRGMERLVADLPPGQREAVLARGAPAGEPGPGAAGVLDEGGRGVNEIADRIEAVLMAAARRRAARRHRRVVAAVALLGVLLLASGATAVTGVGPLGDALTADEKLPPGAKPEPGGESVLLVGEGAGGRRYEVRVYRARPGRRDLPGAHRYCGASYSADRRGKLDPISIVCTSGSAIAARLERRPLWLGCSGRGGAVGRPAPPDPVCGLALAVVREVTIDPRRGSAGEVKLSRPFSLRVDHAARVLRVRAVLGVVEAPDTQPGERTPAVEVTAVRPDGSRFVAHVGGRRLPTTDDVPSFDPRPASGSPRAEVGIAGPDGRRWTARTWRTAHGDVCAGARPAGVPRTTRCAWVPELGIFRSIVLDGAAGFITKLDRSRSRGRQAVFGFARADLRRLAVRDTAGRLWPAALSEPWTAWRRRPDDLAPVPRRFRRRFAGLPRSVRLRAFIAVIPAEAAPPYPVRLRFEAR
jgi:DNA-directed RNA polymerase specialized sigma24 family protein